jgi:hypothetical protein
MSATLRWAVGLLAVEAAAELAVVVFLLVELFTMTGTVNVRAAIGVIVFVALLAGAFAGLALALGRRQSWARSPAVVLQLLMVPAGSAMVQSLGLLGGAVLLAGLVGAGLLLAPTTRVALGRN